MLDARTLARGIRGRVIVPGDAEYDASRRVWNGMIDRHPAAIARCTSPEDVAAVVGFAVDAGVPLAVRGGGHNVAGNATCDGGVVIDLSAMKTIAVDREARRARAGGGALWGQFDAATQDVGLATTGGLIPSTGVAGFTLGGGLGHLMRSCGLACDNLLSADVVTADGRLLHASADQEPDLYWALRGGGGNFGVVTEFEFRLHEVGPMLLSSRLAYPLSDARDALRFYRDVCATAPDALIVYAGLLTGPDGGALLSLRAVFNGPVTEGEAVVAPLRAYGAPLLDDTGPRPYTEIQRILEPVFPAGRLNYWKASFADDLSDELIDVVVEAYRQAPSRYSVIAIEPMGGAIARVAETDTAFQHRTPAFSLLILGGWVDASENEANIAWARNVWDRARPLSSDAVYVNYLGTEGEQRVKDAFGVNHRRLSEVKRAYDPDNVFRFNQNIEPASSA